MTKLYLTTKNRQWFFTGRVPAIAAGKKWASSAAAFAFARKNGFEDAIA